jgi:putative ABC transport system permease protein
MIETLSREVRLAARSLLREPGFTAVAVLTFALGIGGTSMIFTAVDAAFIRPLPYPDADRIVTLWQTRPDRPQVRVSMLDALDWRAQSRSFSRLAVLNVGNLNVTQGASPLRVTAAYVTGDFFAALGVSPIQGRTFSAEEALGGGPRSVVISRRLWRQVFGSDPGILRRTLSLEGLELPVIGVMPERVGFPDGADLWLPLATDDGTSRGAHNYRVIARLKPGVSLPQARRDLETVAARLARDYPASDGGFGVAVIPLRTDLLGATGPVILLLLGAVSCVLLITCANAANLLLARAVAHRSDLTVRLALGADRSSLLRRSAWESILLALAGGAAGLALAFDGGHLIAGLAPAQTLGSGSFQVDGVVLLFTLALACVCGLACGIAPAVHAMRLDLRTALTAEGRGSRSGRGMKALIAAEVTAAFVLLAGAGLLLRSAYRLAAVDPGFNPRHVVVLDFAMGGLGGSRYNDPEWRSRFFRQLLDRASAGPGVEAAGLISQPPLSGGSYSGALQVDRPEADAADPGHVAHYRLIGGDYFKALRIPLLRGRLLSPQEGERTPKVALVNQSLAVLLAPGGRALGLRIRIPGMDSVKDWAEVVGVVADVRHRGLASGAVPEVYFPFAQRPARTWMMSLVARSRERPEILASWLGRQVEAVDRGVPFRFRTLDELLAADLAQPLFRARLLGGFAATALLLAGLGIFGVVTYVLGQRTREVGIRVALGADRRAIGRFVLQQGLVPVLLGIAAGAVASLGLMRLLASLVFQIGVSDPATLVAVSLVLLATAGIASLPPLRRALRADPVQALRSD